MSIYYNNHIQRTVKINFLRLTFNLFLLIESRSFNLVIFIRHENTKYFLNMPQHKSAIKRLRQSKARRDHNRARRSKMRTLIKKVMSTENKEEAAAYLKDAVSLIDRLATKNIIHPNTAARKKSQLTTYVNNL